MIVKTALAAQSFDTFAPYLIIGLYFLAMVIIALISHKKSRTLNSFFLADRGIGGWISAFAYGTTYFSAVVFVGYAGKFGMSMGLAAVWIGIANAFLGAFLPWVVLGKRTRRMTQRINSGTMPTFFEKRYDDRKLKLVSSIIIFVFLIPYSTSVYQGLGMIFEMVFGVSFYWCIIIMACITALYLFVGGYFATALSDFLQGLIMLAGVITMVALMMKTPQVNGIEGLKTLTQSGYGLVPSFTSTDKVINSPGFNLIVLIVLTSFGVWSLPQIVHKFNVVRDNSAIKKAAVISTIFALIIGGLAYFNGGLARLFFPDAFPAGGADAVIPSMLINAGFSKAMLAFILVLVLAASMSTLSSLTLCSASAVAIDAYKGFIRTKAKDNEVKILLRTLCIVFIGISAVLAIFRVDAIVTLMSLSWGCLAGCFSGPYIYGLYSKKITAAAVMTSLISGVTLTIGLVITFGAVEGGSTFGEIIKLGIARSPLIGVICMAFSMIITPVVSIFTKKPDPEKVAFCFSEGEIKE